MMSLWQPKSDKKLKFSDFFPRRRSKSLPRKPKDNQHMRPLESLYASIVTNNNNSNVFMMSNNNNNNNVDYLDPCTPYVSINYDNGPYSKGPPLLPTPPPNFRDENYYETNLNSNKKGGILSFLKRHFTKSTPALREQDYSDMDSEEEQMRAARSAHLQHLLRHLAARSLEQEQGWRRRIEERRRRDEEDRRRGIFHSQRSRRLRTVSAEEGERRWEFEMWRRRFQEQKRREEEQVLRRVRGRRRRVSQGYMFRDEEEDDMMTRGSEEHLLNNDEEIDDEEIRQVNHNRRLRRRRVSEGYKSEGRKGMRRVVSEMLQGEEDDPKKVDDRSEEEMVMIVRAQGRKRWLNINPEQSEEKKEEERDKEEEEPIYSTKEESQMDKIRCQIAVCKSKGEEELAATLEGYLERLVF